MGKKYAVGCGPDWTDVGVLLKEIGKSHGCTCEMKIEAGGARYDGAIVVTVSAIAPTFVGPAQCLQVSMWSVWPTQMHATMEGLVFNLLYRLDYRLASEWWRQKELPLDGLGGTIQE